MKNLINILFFYCINIYSQQPKIVYAMEAKKALSVFRLFTIKMNSILILIHVKNEGFNYLIVSLSNYRKT